MSEALVEIIRRHCRKLDPIPTDQSPRLQPLSGIRAVLLDIYGTLFISASGEVGSAKPIANKYAFTEALQAVGLGPVGSGEEQLESLFFIVIQRSHARSRREGIDYPEVDVRNVWRQTLEILEVGFGVANGKMRNLIECGEELIERLAVEYEVRANPVWPMPGVADFLDGLSRDGKVLGILSNAQFFTPLLFDALLGRSLGKWGFSRNLQFFSYQHRRAKPGDFLFRLAKEELGRMAIRPQETIFVGNDMLNDVMPAQRNGFRTALFAGDRRSLRLREEDARCEGVEADLVLTDLAQLIDCLSLGDADC